MSTQPTYGVSFAVEGIFTANTQRTPTCWLWTGSVVGDGYGEFQYMGKRYSAHRLALQLDGRPVPRGMHADHTCRNKLCVNPAHLRVVTPKVNALENSVGVAAINAAKTHCPKGHPLSGANLYLEKKGSRSCKECHRIATRQWKQKKRGAPAAKP